MAKGRQKKPPADQRDTGTPEALAQKLARVQGGHPTAAENPLAALLEMRLISSEMASAGNSYGRLYRACIGIVGRRPGRGEPISDDDLADMQAEYAQQRLALKRAGQRIKAAVEDAAVFGVFVQRTDEFALECLKAGLRVLLRQPTKRLDKPQISCNYPSSAAHSCA